MVARAPLALIEAPIDKRPESGRDKARAGRKEADQVNEALRGNLSFGLHWSEKVKQIWANGNVAPVLLGLAFYCGLVAYRPGVELPAIIPWSLGLTLVITALGTITKR